MRFILLFLALIFFMKEGLRAADFSQNSVTILAGNDFEVGGDRRRIELTYESLNIFSFGDSFFWMDVTSPFKKEDSGRNTNLYGEWAPRLSFSKLFNFSQEGLIKDFTFSNAFEFGNNTFGQTRSRLHGLGVDLNITGFRLLSFNFYLRDNLDRTGTTFQTSIIYLYPFKAFKQDFLFNAYIDIVHGEEGGQSDKREAHWHMAQQLHFYILPKLSIGFEYQYWSQKFGFVDAPAESNLKLMGQWIF